MKMSVSGVTIASNQADECTVYLRLSHEGDYDPGIVAYMSPKRARKLARKLNKYADEVEKR